MKNKRRSFLKKSAIAGTGFFIVPRNVLGGTGFTSPSDQLNIAAIGAGGKGNDLSLYKFCGADDPTRFRFVCWP